MDAVTGNGSQHLPEFARILSLADDIAIEEEVFPELPETLEEEV